jgi:hypothetical protein
MKNFVLFLLPFLLCLSCKKAVEKAQEKAVVESITNGFWKVALFQKGAIDVTNGFAVYKFQFKENNTVDAFKNNTVERTGSWEGNAIAMTITSSFGNVPEPLFLLNGIWKITKNSLTRVEANQTVSGEQYLLHLVKE